ncbi:MAG: hypothetical protein LUE31_08235 [Lachnospiraceae bacterium]|nr:hypothetical protein [Lachnospiraceae bacterium]
MVQLFEREKVEEGRQSSKGNQLKWKNGHRWYKADYAGYEGLAEYVSSRLMDFSTLDKKSYIAYDTEEIQYRDTKYRGCVSDDFLPQGWQMITLERLFHSCRGESLYRQIYQFAETEDRLRFLVEETQRMTGLRDFGIYISRLLTLDALFLNEDRHMHNIAVLMDEMGNFHECPVFDNGAALLSDMTMDYPLSADVDSCMRRVRAKTLCPDFDEQLDTAEKLYGKHIRFSFERNDLKRILSEEPYYPEEMKARVAYILTMQMRKYRYLW